MGNIYFGSDDGYIYSVDSAGVFRWKYYIGGAVTSSPAIGPNGVIYLGSDDGYLYGFTQSGSLWMKSGIWGGAIKSAPAIGPDGTIYFGISNNRVGVITPSLLGTYLGVSLPLMSSPVVGSDGSMYFADNDWFDALTPQLYLKWHLNLGSAITTTPAIDDLRGRIYVAAGGNLYSLDLATGSSIRIWSAIKFTSPVIGPDGRIYIGYQDLADSSWYLLAVSQLGDCADNCGYQHWRFGPVAAEIKSVAAVGITPSAALAIVYFGTVGPATFYAVTDLGESAVESWSVPLSTESSPTLGPGNVVYVGDSAGVLHAYATEGGLADTPWPMFQHDPQHTGAVPPRMFPATGAFDQSPQALISYQFMENVTGVNASTFKVYDYRTHAYISGTVSYDDQTFTAVFTPDVPLGFDDFYGATLTTGILAGASPYFESDFTWGFGTMKPRIPLSEASALRSFYQTTGGPNWTHSSDPNFNPANQKATMQTRFGFNADLIYTAKTGGTSGNYRVRYIQPSVGPTPLSVALSVDGQGYTNIEVTLQTDSDNNILATANQVKAAIEAYGPANALVDITRPDTSDGTGIVSTMWWGLSYGGYDKTNWLGPTAFACSFFGVTCNPAGDTVIGIELPSNNLTGILYSGGGGLPNLEFLRLPHNHMTSIQIAGDAVLQNMTVLDLRDNQFSGPLTGFSATHDPNLVELYLSSNDFSGPIPTEFGSLALDHFDVNYNRLHLPSPDPNDVAGLLAGLPTPAERFWQNTQTLPPTGLHGVSATSTTIRLGWTPILYTADSGGYEVYKSLDNNIYTLLHTTADKFVNNYDVGSLSPDTPYYLKVRTRTNPHNNPPNNNQNTLLSDYTAPIEVEYHVLTVQKTGGGGGAVTSSDSNINCGIGCSQAYLDGAVVTLTAAPDAASRFVGWSGGGCEGAGTNPCDVTVNESKLVTAQFEPNNTLTVTKTGSGSGRVVSNDGRIDCGADCNEIYAAATLVTLTAAPDAGSAFTGWSGGGCAGTDPCVVNVNQPRNVNASFELVYTITPTATAGGFIAPNTVQTVLLNGSKTFNITANPNHHIVDVLVDGVSQGAIGQYTFNNVTADHTIFAIFAIDTHTITATAGPGGTIAPSGPVVINHSGSLMFDIAPAANHHIVDVVVNGVTHLGAVNSYTFNNVTADQSIAATFGIDQHTVTA